MRILGRLLWLLFAPAWGADLTLAPVFTSHLVVQRDTPIPVWGRARPGAVVVGEFAGENRRATAGGDGRWRLQFPPAAARTRPAVLRVTSGDEECRIEDVLVGEVWLCAGQSNMEWPLAKEAHAADELPGATQALVRLFNPDYAGKERGGNAFTPAEVRQLAAERYFQGEWTACVPPTAAKFSAIGYYFAKELSTALGVPVGVIHLAVGGSPAESWMRRETLAGDPELRGLVAARWLENPALEAWCRQRAHENLERAIGAGEVDAHDPPHPFQPGFLWRAAIEPLAPFALRGVLWYQGESNSLRLDRVHQHERMFPLLVRDLRAQWGAGALPFLYCQLSGIETAHYHSDYWPEFRDSQRRLLTAVPHSGMVVTSDVGDPASVHPRDKRTVAARLVRLALAQAYGRGGIASGPRPQALRAAGRELVIAFDSVGTGLSAGGGETVRGFAVAGADGLFFPAHARIERDSVRLTCDHVAAPHRVRYNWQPFPTGNLINGAGWPASTFEMEVER